MLSSDEWGERLKLGLRKARQRGKSLGGRRAGHQALSSETHRHDLEMALALTQQEQVQALAVVCSSVGPQVHGNLVKRLPSVALSVNWWGCLFLVFSPKGGGLGSSSASWLIR